MKTLIILSIICIAITLRTYAQTSTEFWLAPPEITYDHHIPGGVPIYLMVSSIDQAAVITIEQPANPAFNGGTPITINLPANSSHREDLTPFVDDLETKPTDAVLATGLHISSTVPISAYYEIANTNNTDIYALKGQNGLGTEFYIPLQNFSGFYNHTFATNKAYASFDIVATEDNTTVMIYSKHDVDGHAALTPFTILLNRGETYSCGWTGANYEDPLNHPTGAVVLSDKPVAVSWKDDSCHNPSGGCYDLMGDQLVPVEIVGQEYIAVRGQLNDPPLIAFPGNNGNDGEESVFATAIQNNTQIFVDGSATPITTLFAGQTFRIEIDNPSMHVYGTKPFYCTHVTGFGCEQGAAILPPLNCAGSEQISFVRSSTSAFFLTLLVRNGSQDDFTITGPGTATINPASFSVVPGTSNEWVSAIIQFNTTEIPIDQAHLIENSTDVFAMGIINGGSTTGCRYGYFSEFVAQIYVDAGLDEMVCANDSVELNGSVGGGVTTGIWTTNGTGSFEPDATALDAIYVPSQTDVLGSLKFWLTSTGACTPIKDSLTVTFTPAPAVSAGADTTVGANNANVYLDGSVTVATAWVWSGGMGSYNPNNTDLNAIYTPSAAEIAAGTATLVLETTAAGICNQESDQMTISIDPGPTADAGPDQIICSNNAANIVLNGSVTNATGGIWSGGNGIYNPSPNALNIFYTPTATEIALGTLTLTLTTTGHGANNPATNQMTITFSDAPEALAGSDRIACANNPDVTLAGTVIIATGGTWTTSGNGTFTPNADALNATYQPSIFDVNNGSVSLTLTTTGNGTCLAESDPMTILFSQAPVVGAGTDVTLCANNALTNLNGTISGGATAGIWSGGTGTFSPNNTSLSASYLPSAAEINSGTVTLTLTTTDHGISGCSAEQDDVKLTFTPAPGVSAGPDKTICGNNADVLLNGSVTIASGGIWSNGAGLFNPGANVLNPLYTPSASEIASGTATLVLTSTGNGTCNAEDDTVIINITPPPLVNAGSDQILCANNALVSLNGSVSGATNTGQWSGGLGIFSPSSSNLSATYTPSAGEISSGTLNLVLTSTNNGDCIAETDGINVTFTAAPIVDAGLDQTVGGNNAQASLNGSVTGASGGIWTGGLGSYSPNSASLTASYTPSAAEVIAGSVTLYLTTTGYGNCNPVTDSITITIEPAPVVNAGPDITACENNANINLNGTITNATGGTWSNGSGSFIPGNTALNAVYIPTPAEVTSGSLKLYLTSTGNGQNNPVTDSLTITFNPAPSVNAGPDQSVCANNSQSVMSGSVSLATGGIWSNGLGTFSPSTTNMNAVYTPTQTEINSGSVKLILTSTGNGACLAVSDSLTVTFDPAPQVEAGPNQTLCANNANATINGSVTGPTTTGIWSGGLGTFTPSNTSLNTSYTPHSSEISAGSVKLFLTSTGNGNCNQVKDSLYLYFTPAPTVNAGVDISACENNNTVSLNGAVNGSTGGSWSGGLGSFNPGNTNLAATYTPTAGEISNGSVTLTLTSTGNGTCNPVTDQVMISYSSAPSVNAGMDQTVCGNNSFLTLNGNVTGASGGQWSGGSGSYTNGSTTLNTGYQPSASEISSGVSILTLTSTGNGTCSSVSDQVTISITPAPTVDAGINQTVCANNPDVALSATYTIVSGGFWNNGGGSFAPDNLNPNAIYSPSASEVSNGKAVLFFTTTGNGGCNAVSDSMVITISPPPSVNAGTDISACRNNPTVTLNGTVTGATGGQWTGGSGVFNPNNTTLNATYTPTAGELSTGNLSLTLTSIGNGNCNSVSDEVVISFTDAPTANAGSDKTVCENNSSFQLNGSITQATGGIWSGGLGLYNPDNTSMNAAYTPTAGELSAGSLDLILSTTGNGTCLAVDDTIRITFTTAPTAFAGNDLVVCANNQNASLSGAITVATGGIWSGGTGSFNPSASSLSTTYTPSAQEITNGVVTLTLNTTGNGNCLPVSDQVQISISPSPVVSAGNDQSACENNATMSLTGTVANAGGGIWSGGSGVFNPGNTSLNATYTPTPTEITNGSVSLVLSSTNNGSCLSVSDQVVVSFNTAPSANAGPDQTKCANNPVISLNGSVNLATGGIWSGGLGTFSPSSTALNATYTPTAGEIALGFVDLTLTTTGNGNCNAASDNIHITFTQAPVVDAGTDQSVCGNNASLSLGGSVTVSTGGLWTSTGSGTFSPSATNLNATYIPSQSDISSGSVLLTLTSTGNGTCLAVADQLNLTVTASPAVNAGTDQTVCPDNLNVSLNGSISGGASTGIWSSTGTGTFVPGNVSLNATYVASSIDSLNQQVLLYLTSTNNGNCIAVSDSMSIFIYPAGTADAGNDITLCSNNAIASLSGTVGGGATTGIWSTSGTGTFSPSASSLNTTYIPSSFDTSNGNVTLTLEANSCNLAEDQINITYSPAPWISAGEDIDVCINNPTAALNGSVTVASGAIWTGGSGNFSPNNTTLDALYTPSASELSQGIVQLVLSSTGNGTCNIVRDTVRIMINPPPVVNAGNNVSVCANNAEISLSGTVTGGSSTGQWSTSGSGTFSPDANSLNAVYVSSSSDISSGSVILTLTSTNNGGCVSVSDNLTITYTNAPTANAGPDVSACANNVLVPLSGSVSLVSGGIWTSTGTGQFIPSNTVLNPTYVPSSADTASGSVSLTLTTTGNGNCLAVSDNMTITMTQAPFVNAGADIITCVDDLEVTLYGSVSGPTTTGIWTTSGSGSFLPNNTSLIVNYQASPLDSVNGGVTLQLTSTGNGGCLAVHDELTLSISPAGVANAGIDQTVCANNATVTLGGIISGGATAGIWTTSGNGSFVPNASSLNATYIPGAVDTSLGSVTLTLTSTNSCNAASDAMVINFTQAPQAFAGLDQIVCGNNANASLNGSVQIATGGVWSTSGSGTFVPANNIMNPVYIPGPGDITTGSAIISLTTTNNGNCNAVSDNLTLTISPAPSVFTGPDQVVCQGSSMTQLLGFVSGSTNTGIWTSSGTGNFIPSNTVLTSFYEFSPADIAAGSVDLVLTSTNNGTCNPVSESITITFGDSPFVHAGVDQYVCANENSANLSGVVSGGSTTGQWTTSGSGYFYPSGTSLNGSYYFSTADSIIGSVTLILQSTNNGSCSAGSDTMRIILEPVPVANAGLDKSVCETDSVQLNGIIANATGGIWSGSGTGTFSPSVNVLSPLYIPSVNDISNGGVTLYLSSTGSNSCSPSTDSVRITFIPKGEVFAGSDLVLCGNNATASLSGTITNGASTGLWSTTGSGNFLPNSSTLNATYVPSPADTSAGTVGLTLTATNSCDFVADELNITYTQVPTANAGPDKTVCANNANITLQGSVTIASNGIWSTSGDGSFVPDSVFLSSVYEPGEQDKENGHVYITLTTIGNGDCAAVSDYLQVNITGAPVVNAGPDQSVCSSGSNSQLLGSVTGPTSSGVWTTNGSGTFMPDEFAINAYYQYTPLDTLTGSLVFTLTSTSNGICNAESDQMVMNFGSNAFVYAGEDNSVCVNDLDYQLNATVAAGATTGVWSTSGTGIFVPNANIIDALYQFSTTDSILGQVNLILTSTNNGGCNPGIDTIQLSVEKIPVVDAGSDRVMCSTDDYILINAITQYTQGVEWTTTGDGHFEPNENVAAVTYIPGNGDLNSGNVTLTISSTGSVACAETSDQINISIIPEGIVSAGPDITICANIPAIPLAGNIAGGAAAGIWTSTGTGTFTPSATTLNANYVPSAADTSNQTVRLILTATNSCNPASDTLDVFFTPAPVVNAGTDQTVCANNAVVTLLGQVQIAAGAIWSTSGDGLLSPGGSSLNTYFSPGDMDIDNGMAEIYLTSTGNGTCIAVQDTIVVHITPAPVVSAGPDQSVCISATNTFLIGSVTGGASTGQWIVSNGTGTIANNSDLITGYTFGPGDQANGFVTLQLTSTNNGTCLSESDQVIISFGNAPFVYAGEDMTICAGTPAELNGYVAGGSTTGQWITTGSGTFVPDNTTLNADYIPSTADSIYGIVNLILVSTNNGTCNAGSDTVQVGILNPPLLDAGGPYFICDFSDTIQLGGTFSNTSSVLWSTNGTGVFYPDATMAGASYLMSSADTVLPQLELYFTATDNSICALQADTTTIQKINAIVPDFSHSIACAGQTVIFNDISSIIQGSVVGWSWDLGDGSASASQTVSHTYSNTGSFDVTLTVSSSLGCSYSITRALLVNPIPVADFTFTESCIRDSVVYSDASFVNGGSIASWSWAFGDGDSSQVQNPEHGFALAGNYTSELTVSSNAGCSSSISKLIPVYSIPQASFTYSFDCSSYLTSFYDASSSSGLPVTSWNWNFGDGVLSSQQNPEHIYSGFGSYQVTLISGYSTGCSDTVSVDVSVMTIVPAFSHTRACAGHYVQFLDSSIFGGGQITSWTWDFGDGNTSQQQYPVNLYDSDGFYLVSLEVSSNTGCTEVYTDTIAVNPQPIAAFNVNGNDFIAGQPVNFHDNSTGASSWYWDFGDQTGFSVLQEPSYIFNSGGTYIVKQVVENAYQCADSTIRQVVIFDDAIYAPVVPSGFTPNGDGENDVLLVRGGPFKSMVFQVYNKWGQRLFYTTDSETGWDGSFKDEDQPPGVYVYILEAITIDEREFIRSDDVTLIR